MPRLGIAGAGSGTRTRTARSGRGILSPLRLPFRHPGTGNVERLFWLPPPFPGLERGDAMTMRLGLSGAKGVSMVRLIRGFRGPKVDLG